MDSGVPDNVVVNRALIVRGFLAKVVSMRPPFPGMDPWLEDPTLWPDVHNSLIAAIANALSDVVAPKYYIGLKQRTYMLGTEDLPFVGLPDLSVTTYQPTESTGLFREGANFGMVEVLVPMIEEYRETFLEVRDARGGKLITLVEVLSPVNKMYRKGRDRYLMKRGRVLESRTGLVEIDLLRDGKPMPFVGQKVASDYRVLVSARPGPVNSFVSRR
jgi:hypothetical protein